MQITLNIRLPNRTLYGVSFFESQADVEKITKKVVENMIKGKKPNHKSYALRLYNVKNKEVLWLPATMLMSEVVLQFFNPKCVTSCPIFYKMKKMTEKQKWEALGCVWRVELRVRYLPKSIKELYESDIVTFQFFFEQVCQIIIYFLVVIMLKFFQVKEEYVESNTITIDEPSAVELCCLTIKHYFNTTYIPNISEKKHVDYIDKEIGFQFFLPKSLTQVIKPKQLKKSIQTGYKKVYNYSDVEYMKK